MCVCCSYMLGTGSRTMLRSYPAVVNAFKQRERRSVLGMQCEKKINEVKK